MVVVFARLLSVTRSDTVRRLPPAIDATRRACRTDRPRALPTDRRIRPVFAWPGLRSVTRIVRVRPGLIDDGALPSSAVSPGTPFSVNGPALS